MGRTDLYLERLARERQFEMDCDMGLVQESSLMADNEDISPRKMPVGGTERA